MTQDTQYVIVKDSSNISNIWQIVNKFLVDGLPTYEIHSRTTTAYIEKEFCFVQQGSSLLYYENGDKTIDIEDSEIEIESEEEYEEFIYNETKNINPFKVFDEVDLGYLEPEYNEPWDLAYTEEN